MALKIGISDVAGKTVYVFRGKDVLAGADPALFKDEDIEIRFEETGSGCVSIGLKPGTAADIAGFKPLRAYFASQPEEKAAEAARMKGYTEWLRQTRFCPSCGAALVPHERENALVCTACGKTQFPKIEPCIILIITKGDDILLLRHVQRNQDLWCCLAGFVETGESLEQALIREVREETSLEVENIRYVGSQSWPFPDQLMLAFYADYKSGEIKVQEDEIFEARWFDKKEIPTSPGPGSISWRLIHFDF